MKQTNLAMLFFFADALSGFAQRNGADNSDEKVLRYLKKMEWPKAYRRHDAVLLDRILAEEFKMIDSDGEYSTKGDQIEYVTKNTPNYTAFKFIIKRLEIFENNTAIISGTGIIKNKDKDGEFELVYQSSNVLIKRENTWKAIFSHTSGNKIVRNP